jgi:glutathione S-transferase
VGGRIAYAVGYLQAAEKRGPGFGISFLSSAMLLVMALVGAIRVLL